MKITLAFYTAKGNYKDWIIRKWTNSNYSHVEMIINDSWISSSSDKGGVTIKPLKELSNDYEYVDINVDGRRLKKVLQFIETHKDAKYDWWGLLFGTVLNSNLDDKTKFFCSEMMTILLQNFHYEKSLKLNSSRITPGDLYNLIKF